jgi:serine/threonine-protein kinase
VHQGTTPNELLVKTATEPAPPLRSVWPEAPEAIAAVIDRALLRDKTDRWKDARSMLVALQSARESLGLPPGFVPFAPTAEERLATALAATIGSDPNPNPSHTVESLGQLTTAHDVASSVSLPVPLPIPERHSRKRWLAAALAATLLIGVSIGVLFVVRTGQTAPAAAASELAPLPAPSAAPALLVQEPVVTQSPPAETPPPRVEVTAADAAAPPERPRAPVVVRPQVRPREPKAPPVPSSGGPSISWDKR